MTAIADAESARIDNRSVDVSGTLAWASELGTLGDRQVENALNGPYDVLIETTATAVGDAEPAFSHVVRALQQDRHVVLGNKRPVAERYSEVRAAEAASDGEVRFKATVGGPIPVLSMISDIGSEDVSGIHGVSNGLANFILSRMTAERLGYEHVLAEAQDLGLAEMDPSFDVEGTDAGLTCSVLANVLDRSGTEWTLADIDLEGIKDIPGSALGLAREEGRTVRLIGEVSDDRVRVVPRLISETSPLAVRGTRTVIQIQSKYVGSLTVSGAGATAPEVAAAILTDVNRLNDG